MAKERYVPHVLSKLKSHKKLKQEHRELAHKYQELEFAYEAIDPYLENFVNKTIEKVQFTPLLVHRSLQ